MAAPGRMKRPAPNRLGARDISAIMAPITAALVALRLGRATEDHYNDIAAAFVIAQEAAMLVQRHGHLIEALEPAVNALNAVFERRKQRTVPDAPWSGTPEEVDEIENGTQIYRAILLSTPGKTMLKAINHAGDTIRSAEPTTKERHEPNPPLHAQ